MRPPQGRVSKTAKDEFAGTAGTVLTAGQAPATQIPGITQMTSLSTLGAAQVVIQFDLNRNIDAAAQDVQAAISIAGKGVPLALGTGAGSELRQPLGYAMVGGLALSQLLSFTPHR